MYGQDLEFILVVLAVAIACLGIVAAIEYIMQGGDDDGR
jgi:hypothetical protein